MRAMFPPGGKSRADDFRRAYYRRRKDDGKPLKWIESDYFEDESGCRLGVTWSKEGNGCWFLNLMEGKFDEAVLLCQIRTDAARVIHLPRPFVNRWWHSLSRDKKGEIKFKVVKHHGHFCIDPLKPADRVDVSEFVENEPLVCAVRKEYE